MLQLGCIRQSGSVMSTTSHRNSLTIKMMQIWIVLFFLHRGYTLISVATAELGEPVTFTCVFSDVEYSNTKVKWYKQNIGDTLRLITTLMKGTTDPGFEKGFPSSRFAAVYTTTKSTLTILKTTEEDEALYHCEIFTWEMDRWTGTFLSLKKKNPRTTNYTVVQWPTASASVRPGESVELQCSVLSDNQLTSCPSERSVSWFGVRSDRLLGNILYTREGDRKPNASSTSKSCVYHFSKNASASDSGVYYCALATCGEIMFGNGAKLEIEEVSRWSPGVLQLDSVLSPIWTVLAITVLACLVTLIKIKFDSCKALVHPHRNVTKRNQKREEDPQIYSTAVFTVIKSESGGRKDVKAVESRKTYAAAKAFGVD